MGQGHGAEWEFSNQRDWSQSWFCRWSSKPGQMTLWSEGTVTVHSLCEHCEDGMRSTELSKHGCLFLPILSVILIILTSLQPHFFQTYSLSQVTLLPKNPEEGRSVPIQIEKMASGFTCAHLGLCSGTAALCLVC